MNKPITLEEMTAYVDATWKKCQSEAWGNKGEKCMKRQLKEGDWIALRLLALLLKTDVSNQSIPDVRKTMDYYRHELGIPLDGVIWALITETADEVENPESAVLRKLEGTLEIKQNWVNLTEQEIGELYNAGWANNMDFARAIEAKVKEKNT